MIYSFSEAAEKKFLEEHGFKNVDILGRGAQSHVWKGTNPQGDPVAIKLQFGDTTDFTAEQMLEQLKPEILKKRNLNELFKKDTKLHNLSERYYKYNIVFENQKQQNNTFIEMLNYDFNEKNFAFTVNDIFKVASDIKGEVVDSLDNLSSFFGKSKAKANFILDMTNRFKNIDVSSLNPLVDMLKNNKFYVSIALLADQSLDKYILEVDSKRNVEFAIGEVRKIAKHILKALKSLHNDGIVHRDLHGGNITRTVVSPDGQQKKVKYQLIDFGASFKTDENNREKNIREDLQSFGYGVLIPVFYQLVKDEQLSSINAANYNKISEIASTSGVDPNFVDFLKKLKNDFKNVDDALKHSFIKSNK